MRTFMLAVPIVLAFGWAGPSLASPSPAGAQAIVQAARAASATTEAGCRIRRWCGPVKCHRRLWCR
jgi:hypothetical protein